MIDTATPAGPLEGRLGELWRGARDRLLANPRFRALVAAFPPTRRIARRRAAALFDLCAGFVYSQVLLALVRTGLLERLAREVAAIEKIDEAEASRRLESVLLKAA